MCRYWFSAAGFSNDEGYLKSSETLEFCLASLNYLQWICFLDDEIVFTIEHIIKIKNSLKKHKFYNGRNVYCLEVTNNGTDVGFKVSKLGSKLIPNIKILCVVCKTLIQKIFN